MAKTKKELLHSIFRGSNILKRDVDKAILYYNLPEFLVSQMFVPQKMNTDPNQNSNFPEAAKIIQYFNQNQNHKVPNLILFEIVTNVNNTLQKYVIGAFNDKGWTSKLIVDRKKLQNLNSTGTKRDATAL